MSDARRITHVVENLERGGLERVVIDLAREQARRGDAVQVLCLFGRGALAGELEAAGVPVHACGKRGGLDLGALRRLRAGLRAHHTGVLHTHNAAAHYHAVLAALGLGIRTTVNTRHGMGVQQAGSRREWLFRRTLARTDRVATVCEAARREVAAAGLIPAAKLVAVPNGIRLDAFAPGGAAEREALAVELGLPPATPVVGAVGRMNWAKDPQGMLEAFRILLAGHPQAVLAWAGDGAERPAFEAAAQAAGIADRVRALGDRGDVPRLLRGFTVYAMSSRTEGYSIALLEACASGLPIVATDVGGNREIVREGVNGLLVPAGDPPALAAALARLLDDPARAAAMASAGLAFVRAEGSLEAMAARYRLVYAGNDAGDSPH
jgi:glycosyltransferase involved in cell wall biosynthesis